jgi:hypothetical protein
MRPDRHESHLCGKLPAEDHGVRGSACARDIETAFGTRQGATVIPDQARTVIFISKGTPEDDDFVLWLAPRLEAQGYRIFADILSLEPGDRWRREITGTLQDKAAKMLLCCRDGTLAVGDRRALRQPVSRKTRRLRRHV